MASKSHWESVYSSKASSSVSWYQEHASQSLNFIARNPIGIEANIIDIGGGASTLVDDLLTSGYRHLSVLDLSAEALAVAQRRLKERARFVNWIEGDITSVELPAHQYDVWHDRAVFHFLTDPKDRQAYVAQVMRSVKPSGHVIVATFSEDGPEKCSGLPVVRYSPLGLHNQFGDPFQLLDHLEERHPTPGGNVQPFIYCHCLKTA